MGDEAIVAPLDHSPPGSVITAVPERLHPRGPGTADARIHFTAGFLGIITSGYWGSWLSVDVIISAASETENGGSADIIVSDVTGANAEACHDYSTLTDSAAGSLVQRHGRARRRPYHGHHHDAQSTARMMGSGGIGARIQADMGGNVTANLANVIARGTSGDPTLVQQGGADPRREHRPCDRGAVGRGAATSTRRTRKPWPRSWSTRPPDTFANWWAP